MEHSECSHLSTPTSLLPFPAYQSDTNDNSSTHTPTPKATSTQNPSTPSSLVSGSNTLDPLAQILLLAVAGVFATFALGL
jgi:hypothetical protein